MVPSSQLSHAKKKQFCILSHHSFPCIFFWPINCDKSGSINLFRTQFSLCWRMLNSSPNHPFSSSMRFLFAIYNQLLTVIVIIHHIAIQLYLISLNTFQRIIWRHFRGIVLHRFRIRRKIKNNHVKPIRVIDWGVRCCIQIHMVALMPNRRSKESMC